MILPKSSYLPVLSKSDQSQIYHHHDSYKKEEKKNKEEKVRKYGVNKY